MNDWGKFFFALSFAALAGCLTVTSARETQARLSSKGKDDAVAAVEPVDLRGRPLRALVAFALENRPSMRSATLAVEDARLALREIAAGAPIASATPWNAVDLSASLGYSESSPSAHFEDLSHTRKGKVSGALSLDLLVWDFGRNAAQAKAQAEKVIAAEQNGIQEGYVIFNEVSSTYFKWLRAEALLEAAHTNVAESVDHLQQAELKLELGEVKDLDVTRARVDLSQARQSLVAASNDVVTAGANLMAALGVDAARGSADAVLGKRRGGLDCVLRVLPPTAASTEESFAFASTNAPAMRIARAKLRAASADVDYAVANLMPTVSASLSLNWTDPLWYWRWGVDAVQSLFTGFRKTTAVDRARVALESAAVAVDEESQQLSTALELAVAERDNAAEALATAIVSVRQTRENLETVKEQYELGEASRVDCTEAISAYTTALGDRITAFYRGQIAEAQICQLIGVSPEMDHETWVMEDAE